MKPAQMPLFKTSLLPIILFCLCFSGEPRALGSAEDQIDSGLEVAKAWVAEIDAGQYDDSYTSGSEAMHDKIPQDLWQKVLKALREPRGPVVSRKQISHIYRPNGYEGTEGEFLVITYDTTFAKSGLVTEVVVLRWEGGKWRGAGYNAGAKASPDDNSGAAASQVQTEIRTDPHVKPAPSSQ